MPKTRDEIDAVWEPLHAKLTKLYCVVKNPVITKELFEKTHAVIWLLHEKQSMENGILADYETNEITKKMRSTEIIEMLSALKTADVDALIEQLKGL